MFPPPNKTAEYYPPPASAPPPPSIGIPASSANQYYSPVAVPPAFHVQSQAPVVPWSTGLCHCCDDVGNCCVTCFCPCVTFGQIAEIVDRGSSSCGASGALYTLVLCVTGLPCLYSCFYRTKMRGQYSLQENDCPDCVVHCCCEPCALCQEYRELKNRGFDVQLGWQANMEKQARGVTIPPAMEGGMIR